MLARRWSSRRSRSVQGATRSFSSGRSRICFSVSRRVSRTWPTDARASESARASCSSRGCARRTCAGQSKRRAGPRVLLECVHRAFHEPAARRAHRRRESPHRLSAQRRRLGCERSAPCMRRGSCARTSRPRPSLRWRGILARPDPARGCRRFGSSPRSGGTAFVFSDAELERRFISACAGNGGKTYPAQQHRAVHPRVRGERHPARHPLANVFGSVRFIPASAGSTKIWGSVGAITLCLTGLPACVHGVETLNRRKSAALTPQFFGTSYVLRYSPDAYGGQGPRRNQAQMSPATAIRAIVHTAFLALRLRRLCRSSSRFCSTSAP